MDRNDKPETVQPENVLRRFLAAEAADDDLAAERALAALFKELPAIEPKLDFTARLMARIESAPRLAVVRARRQLDLPKVFRLPLMAALLLGGLAAFYLLPAAWLLLTHLPAGSLLATGAGFLAETLTWLKSWSWIGQSAHQLWVACFEVLGSPPVLLAIVVAAVLATLLSRWLWALLEPARRTSHVAFR